MYNKKIYNSYIYTIPPNFDIFIRGYWQLYRHQLMKDDSNLLAAVGTYFNVLADDQGLQL